MTKRFLTAIWAFVVSLGFSILLTSSAPKAAAEPIKIGVGVPLSSVAGDVAEQVYNGAALAAQAAPNINGRDIQIIKIDTKGNPDGAKTAIQRLVELDKVDVIVGINNTTEAMAIKDYISEHKVPTVVNAIFQDLTMGLGNPYLFRASYSDGQIDYPIADWVTKHAPGKRAVTVAVDFAPGYVFVGKFEEIFSGEGRQVIRRLWVPIGTQDFAPYLSQIDPDTDVIYAFLFGNDADRFLRGVHDFGLNSKLVAGLSLAITPQTLGEKALGIVTGTAYSDTMDSPLNREFVSAYRKAYKADPTEYSGIGYTETQLVLAAIRNIKGEVTRQSITDALAKVELPDSIRGPLKFDSRRNIVTNIYIARVEKSNGGFHNVIIDTYQNVSQFWNLSPEEYMAKKPYARK